MTAVSERARCGTRPVCRGLAAAWLCALLLAPAAVLGAPSCPPDRIDERAAVSYVFDGDTLELAGGARLRLIGVNTPELGRDGDPPEPLAIEARTRLQGLLERHGRRIVLRYDAERRDRHRRRLAHAFLDDGTSLAAWLLETGLGFALAVPPNLWNLECLLAAERRARAARAGVWALPAYRPVPSRRLEPGAKGFRLVTGRVIRIGKSRRSVWLNLEGRMALRIDRNDLPYFRTGPRPEELKGRRVLARGWLYTYKGEVRMRIRHPAALEVLAE